MDAVAADAVEPTPPMIRIFGGVAAAGPRGDVDLGGPKQRAVLAALVVEPGAAVSTDRLAEVLWGDVPPARAEASLRGYVSNLRRVLATLGADANTVIQFRERGYVLALPPDRVDLHRFEQGVIDGCASLRLGATADARQHLSDALELWCGAPFGALGERPELADVVARLHQRRADAVEALGDARLALGEHAELTADLRAEIAIEPYRERLRTQLAVALYRSGRHVEALRSLDDARRVLADEVGVEPGPELRALEAAILGHDESLVAPMGAPSPTSSSVRQPIATDTTVRATRPRHALFGRSQELDALGRALDDVRSDGGAVIVSGDAGIGKTSLLRWLRDEATERGLPVGWGRCPESATAAPYRSWSTAIRQVVESGGSAGLADAVPSVGTSADLDDPTARRLTTHLCVVDALRSSTGPVLVVIDDLQWADNATLALLEFLAAELDDLPLLLAVSVRRTTGHELSGAIRDCLAELTRSRNTRQLRLEGLDDHSVAEWLGDSIGQRPTADLTSLLTETTDGNPFYLGELISLMDADGTFESGVPSRLPTSVPVAVQDVVRRRTSRLPPDAQALLAKAAVIGRRFDVDVLAELAGLDVGDVVESLVPAVDAALVEPDDSVPGRLVFVHALVSEALMAEQNPLDLARLHARITLAIEERRAGQLASWLDELAYHACAGATVGTARRAVDYSVAAADIARAAQASRDEAAHLERALAVGGSTGEISSVRRIELLTRCGTAMRESGDLTAGRAALVDACLLAESVGDDAAIATALSSLNSDDLWAGLDWSTFDQRVVALIERALSRLADDSAEVDALLSAALAAELLYLDAPRSRQLSSAAVESAEAAGDALVLARVLLQRYWSLSGSSDTAERTMIADRLVELTEADRLPGRFVPLARLAGVSSAYELGEIERVEELRDAARASAHPVRTPTAWAHLLYLESSLALLRGDLDRASALADQLGDALWRVRRFAAPSTRAALLAMVEAERGAVDEAVAYLAVVESTPYGESVCWLRAWILAEAGRSAEASSALAAFDGPLADDWYRTPLTAAGVMAAALLGDRPFLQRHLDELMQLVDRFACAGNGGIVLGPVAYAIALAEFELGDPDAARVHAAQALAMSEHLGAVRWTERIRDLTTRLG